MSQWKLFGDSSKNSRPEESPEISEDTRIVRYMRLSAFFLLLCGRAFMPSLRCLQEIDKLEGRLPSVLFRPAYGHHLKELLEPHEEWLLQKAGHRKIEKISGDEHNHSYFQSLADIWLIELAKRRSVWCWNRYEHESHALWKLYGARGVAVHSTVGNVKRALEASGRLRCLVAAVRYAIPRRMFFAGEDTRPIQSMTLPGYLERPYLYKEIGYDYEQEIRFVFGTSPDLMLKDGTSDEGLPGVFAKLDCMSLFDWSSLGSLRIEISPETPPDERSAIGTIVQSLDLTKIRRLQEMADEGNARYEAVGGSPFTMSDDPSGLFRDLD